MIEEYNSSRGYYAYRTYVLVYVRTSTYEKPPYIRGVDSLAALICHFGTVIWTSFPFYYNKISYTSIYSSVFFFLF